MPDAPRTLADRYRLGAVLSRRGASTTFVAEDLETRTPCVVKELSVGAVVRGGSGEASFDPDDFTKLIELFEREARVLAHLDHPGIPRFIDHFTLEETDDTRLYTVQELVEGETLEARVAAGRHFTEAEAAEILRAVADILAYLHGRSPPLVHRDIKPSNVVLGTGGSVHLVDFGSVRNALDGGDLDGKTIVGTYGYMPIEQYEARAVPQSDFYALGMTLVYLLSHRDPTRISRTGMKLDFRGHVSVSEPFAELLEWMIEPAPEDRPPSAAAVTAALDRIAMGRTPVPSKGRKPMRAAGERAVPAWVSLAAAAALVLLGMGTYFVAFDSPQRQEIGRATQPGQGGPAGASPRSEATPRPSTGSRPTTAAPPPVEAVDGELRLDALRDFAYVDAGWPMRRAVGQTSLPALSETPPPDVRAAPAPGAEVVYFGYMPLGNGEDSRVDYQLARTAGRWTLWVDLDDDEDLSDETRLANEGSGPLLAATVTPSVTVVGIDGPVTRPYAAWIWFIQPRPSDAPQGRMYARHHYWGRIRIGAREYAATAFEYDRHDALLRESGICIDLDADGACAEEVELFHDGDVVRTPTGSARLVLLHP